MLPFVCVQTYRTRIDDFMEYHSKVRAQDMQEHTSLQRCVPAIHCHFCVLLPCNACLAGRVIFQPPLPHPGLCVTAQVYLGSSTNQPIPDKYGLGELWSMNTINITVRAALLCAAMVSTHVLPTAPFPAFPHHLPTTCGCACAVLRLRPRYLPDE